jgi:hypothetical protein
MVCGLLLYVAFLDHSNLCHWVLPFDVAQGGEPAEPFSISIFVLRI